MCRPPTWTAEVFTHLSQPVSALPDVLLSSDRAQSLAPNSVATKHRLILGETSFSYQLMCQPFSCIES